MRYHAVNTLGELEPAVLAEHADAIVAKLADGNRRVRIMALRSSSSRQFWRYMPPPSSRSLRTRTRMCAGRRWRRRKLEPAVLAQHVAAVVAKLADEDQDVRRAALKTLGKLEPADEDAACDAVGRSLRM